MEQMMSLRKSVEMTPELSAPTLATPSAGTPTSGVLPEHLASYTYNVLSNIRDTVQEAQSEKL